MRKLGLSHLPILFLITGCGASATTYVHAPNDTTLGRVVVYRNGVAYFERTADVKGDHLDLQVPADKVDDFLKSLTVVDAQTGQPAPITYPTRAPTSLTGLIDMRIGLANAAGAHRLKLTYVTEAPSWKPSYRVVVGKDGKVNLEAWAIVDNTSGEDWNDVKLGVGSSSALSFRYDLRSVRLVERETLSQNDLFAYAPPTGGSIYGNEPTQKKLVADVGDDVLAMADADGVDEKPKTAEAQAAPTTMYRSPRPRAHHGGPPPPMQSGAGYGGGGRGDIPQGNGGLAGIQSMARTLQGSREQIVVEGFAAPSDGDKEAASLARANKMREELVRNGVDPNNIVAVGRGGVKAIGASGDSGNFIKLAHADGYESLYLHLDSVSPELHVGDVVAQSEVIGHSGTTGRAPGPHLHHARRAALRWPSHAGDGDSNPAAPAGVCGS